ncbi:nitrate reductase cytochrome c-type subunit [Arcobacter sp. F2176]|uniref:nitrate reductase cytochrome c-type subunit n=1 Tax=unclassified Arcobacter TaxID=2593671 RepID=UPI00100A7DA3|nr:nitrate reductase cytochrome c-type subunit [Arcobacter sp. F2176]RXJ81391.1 nitrate reductase [Arcobacter sp. F2176]
MKITKITLGLATITAIFVTGCAIAQKTYSEESLGLRKVDIYTEKSIVPDKTDYAKAAAGTSTKIDRAFENAPPMIPHDVEGMLPITIDNNQCIMCHDPAIAESMGAVPVPKTHLTDFRPKTSLSENGRIVKDGKMIVNTSDLKLPEQKSLGHLAGARFNCSQCHAPQSETKLIVGNNFKADFRESGEKNSSNLIKNIDEGVK